MSAIEELQKLKWVEEAVEAEGGKSFLIKTRKNSLKTFMTHRIQKGGSPWDKDLRGSEPLATPTLLYLPQYWITLNEPGPRNPFLIHLVKKPVTKYEYIAMNPQYHHTVLRREWNVPHKPCYGYGNDPQVNVAAEYKGAATWADRARSAAMYLQGAVPHGDEKYRYYTTTFAHRLGLVGKEYLDEEQKPEEPLKESSGTLVNELYI